MHVTRCRYAAAGAAALLLSACTAKQAQQDPNLCSDAEASAWVRVSSGTTADLRAIGGFGRELIVVGDHGTILHSDDGLSWSQEAVPEFELSVVWDGGPRSRAWLGGQQ